MSIFQRSVTCSFFQELHSHIDKNLGEKFEDMFLVKIASKGTSLTIVFLLYQTDDTICNLSKVHISKMCFGQDNSL